ncbi:DMT family transporter [Pectobacterium quasiaquaticum]|uniref:Threonine/homoserine exporter RhtA n=1 Tax=Pectobacterium quasiaquaticum TaxID=2774015 RepID=A0A9Q2ICX2_9GAMM|nr:DMT family transporter [Pectobacterium quasiaquaticum]MBE5203771.1 DMT family transporter [Pectobacterium quasiaquaticum]MBE5211317.1 DMT family transporter [Pectobacterium quasiaquaticum]MBE5214792.1 DMT family transporter [Pectobacterium quasiaquaticum]MBE5224831.1 DMT family transporter [Pectobacterium quasiaquaticum]URG50320.1 DMT family transporter [Pectobacterium quasiaquaticum]
MENLSSEGFFLEKRTHFFSDKKIVFFIATLCCLLWGSAYPAIKNGYELFHIADNDVPGKLVFAGYRFAFAGLLLLVLAVLSGRAIGRFQRGQLVQLTTLGIFQTSLQYVFFYIGLAYTTGVKGSIMNATSTFFSVLLAHYLYQNDKLNVNKLIGCILGFAGVMAVNINSNGMNIGFTLLGDGFVVIAAFILSASTIYGKRISQTMDPTVMTGYQLAIGGIILTMSGYCTGGTLMIPDWEAVLMLGYLILLSSVAFSLWSQLLKYNRVGMVAPFNFLIPVSGTLLSALFLDESILEWKYFFALVLVCSGIWLVNRIVKSDRKIPL